jgi:hypothetical protein
MVANGSPQHIINEHVGLLQVCALRRALRVAGARTWQTSACGAWRGQRPTVRTLHLLLYCLLVTLVTPRSTM